MGRRNVIALIGISGVGKSTVLAAAAESVNFTHLQASALIKDEIQHRRSAPLTQDQLRENPIGHNQELLVAAFHRLSPSSGLIVLDGHILIDAPTGIMQIEPEVFKALDVRHFIVLRAAPQIILERRTKDEQRKRPYRSIMELSHQQEQSTAATQVAGTQLGVPVTVIERDAASHLVEFLGTWISRVVRHPQPE